MGALLKQANHSTSKGFGELFTGTKNKLTELQTKLGSFLPSFPGMPAAKFLDITLGVDIHPTLAPPLPSCPVPHFGIVYDIMGAVIAAVASVVPPPPAPPEGSSGLAGGTLTVAGVAYNFVKGMAPSVKVHGQFIANAGINVQHMPGVFVHVAPSVAPKAEAEMWMGSSKVLADGSPFSTQFHPTLSCNLVGVPSIPRKGKKLKPKMALLAPTAVLLTITSFGKPVLVGGPPTIDLFQLAMKLGLKGLGKMRKKVKGDPPKIKNDNLDIQPKSKCGMVGEPVDVATGRVYTNNTDFELPGPIPLVWERTYYSNAEINGSLGYNWHHSYNMGIYDMGSNYTLRLFDGRETGLPFLRVGDTYFNRKEQLHWQRNKDGYVLKDASGLYYRFDGKKNREGFQMLSEISTSDGFRIRFRYGNSGELTEIIDSRNQKLIVDSDTEGRVTAVYRYDDHEQKIYLVRYRYDEAGNMVETIDPLNVSKYFHYQGHLLVKLTNQSGSSFYWEYKGAGDNARCIHTWGDGGVLEYHIEYGEGVTRCRNGLGQTTEYYYDERKLIYKVIDANGGVTRQFYNGFEELEVVTDPEGLSTKSVYNEYGKILSQINGNGDVTSYRYDERQNLVHLSTPAGRMTSWEYDELDRIVKRTTPMGDELNYLYEGALLKYIRDKQGRTYTLSYNEQADLEQLVYPNGIFRQWKYDNFGQLIQSRDVKGNRTYFGYDKAGNLTGLEEPDGNIHVFQYDASGNLTEAKDKLHEVAFTYGPMGILYSRTQNGRTVAFRYNRELQLRQIVNEKGERYDFGLDGLGQVVRETGFDGLERNYIRDGAGRVVKALRPGNTQERWGRKCRAKPDELSLGHG